MVLIYIVLKQKLNYIKVYDISLYISSLHSYYRLSEQYTNVTYNKKTIKL